MRKKAFFLLIIIAALFLCSMPALAAPSDSAENVIAPAESTSVHYDVTWQGNYTLMHEITITNHGLGIAFNVKVQIPLMDEAGTLYTSLQEERQTPVAENIYLDAQGHRIAEYIIPYIYGNQSITLTQRYAVEISSQNYKVNRSNVADSYSQQELADLAAYLQPTTEVQSTAQDISNFTTSTINGAINPYQKAFDLFAAVNMHLNYSTGTEPQNALDTLRRGTANCQGYTNLYIACLRAAGIPARQQSGYLYSPQIHTTSEYLDQINQRLRINSLRHTWVEFYLPSYGWIIADPTYTYTYMVNGELQKFVDNSYFANIDSNHRYIAFREGPLVEGDIFMEEIKYEATGGHITNPTFNAYLLFGIHWQSFNDIGDHWAQAAITYCVQNSLFNGISDYVFAPDQPMTRAMFITVIGRLYESLGGAISEPLAPASFTDTKDDYYSKYLVWGVQNQIINGYGDGRFGPDDNISREQMAKIITVFAGMMGEQTELYLGAMPTFADSADIADWAKGDVAYCSDAGIITGMPGNMFMPQDIATRAQVATIVQRLSEKLQETTPDQ